MEPDGSRRLPDSQERQWLQEYEAQKDEEERMDSLLANFEEEAIVEQAMEEYEREEQREAWRARAPSTEADSDSS